MKDATSTITIDRAGTDDALHMVALQQRAFEEEARRCGNRDIPPLMETAADIAQHIRDHAAFVARFDGAIIGTVRGVLADNVCTIRALAIDPTHQGRGIGSALLKTIENALPHVIRFDLTTNTLMENNVAFYERHGYVVTEFVQKTERVKLALMSRDVVRG